MELATLIVVIVGTLISAAILALNVYWRRKDSPKLRAWIDPEGHGHHDDWLKIEATGYKPVSIRSVRIMFSNGRKPAEYKQLQGYVIEPAGSPSFALDLPAEDVQAIKEIVVEDGGGTPHRSKVRAAPAGATDTR